MGRTSALPTTLTASAKVGYFPEIRKGFGIFLRNLDRF